MRGESAACLCGVITGRVVRPKKRHMANAINDLISENIALREAVQHLAEKVQVIENVLCLWEATRRNAWDKGLSEEIPF